MARLEGSDFPDRRELGKLYEELFPRMFSYVSYRIGNETQTEDLVSLIFLRVAENFSKFTWHHKQSFNAWAFKIAQNTISDFHRKHATEQLPIEIDSLPEIASQEAPIEQQLLMKEHFKLLQELITYLTPRAQEVITLRFFGGLSNWEVASVLNIDQRSVSSYLSRGLRALEEKYVQRTGEQKEGELRNEG